MQAYHAVRAGVRVFDTLRLFDWLLADNLNPVAVRVKHESDVAHAPVCQLLLELVAGLLQPLACRLEIIYRYTEMAETFVRFRVAIADLVIWIVFGAVVVCELDDALAVGPMAAVRDGLRAIVCEEVEVELGVRVLDL
jgi:hypothetical protein